MFLDNAEIKFIMTAKSKKESSVIKKILRFLLKFIAWFFVIFIAAILLYFLVYFILSRMTVKAEKTNNPTIVVYLMNSGVHTDFVLPVSNEHVDWRRYFPIENTKEKDTSLTFIAIGWGDKDFYLNTPEWADLTLKTAVSAGLGLGTSAVHATYHASILKDRPTVKLTMTVNQYKRLIKYITGSLKFNKNKETILLIPNFKNVLKKNDAYYDAKQSYSIILSCNTWINNGLKASGQKACVWTSLPQGILYQYGK